MKNMYRVFVLIFCLTFIYACAGPPSGVAGPDEWPSAAPASVGLDETVLAQLTGKFKDRTFNLVHSILIVRHKKLVYEKYFHGFSADRVHPVFSVTKSISSVLTGIAIDEKFLKGVDVKIKPFFTHIEGIDWGNKKSDITIKDILTMTAGLEWNESLPYSDWANSHRRMTRSRNWVKFVLGLPMAYEPGEVFDYNTGATNLLAVIIEKASGMPVDTFTKTYLLEPLGIPEIRYYRDPDGNPCTGGSHGGFFLRPRDMAKIGLLMLEKGKWKGKSVVSSSWVETSSAARNHNSNYGYLWWRSAAYIHGRTIPFYMAMGFGGQRIMVVPELDMVVVITSGYYGPRRRTGNVHLRTIVYRYIMQAVKPVNSERETGKAGKAPG